MAGADKKRMTVDERLRSIGIIMDGNGRWATKRKLSRSSGHVAGARAISSILKELRSLGVKHVTLYAFSTENWKRPDEEVNGLMELIYKYLDEVVVDTVKNDSEFSMRFLGDKSRLPEKLRNKCIEIEEMAKDRTFVCNLALNYGGRAEIARAASNLAKMGVTEITEEDISAQMYTTVSGDPDLIVRTAGEERLSNFLLWQCAYAEFYFSDELWPDFDDDALALAIEDFGKRRRKYGAVK